MMDNGVTVDEGYLGFVKSFENVNHGFLLKNLEPRGLHSKVGPLI